MSNIHVLIFCLMWTKLLLVLAYPLFCSRVKESRKLVPDPADLCPVPRSHFCIPNLLHLPLSYSKAGDFQDTFIYMYNNSAHKNTHTRSKHTNSLWAFSFWNLRLYKIFVMPKHICKEIFRAVYILLELCIWEGRSIKKIRFILCFILSKRFIRIFFMETNKNIFFCWIWYFKTLSRLGL